MKREVVSGDSLTGELRQRKGPPENFTQKETSRGAGSDTGNPAALRRINKTSSERGSKKN